MTQIDSWIAGKKVLLLGFGREGQSTYRLLQKSGRYKELAIADQAAKKAWLSDPDIRWFTGPDYQKCMDDYDVVFKSPGIVLERPFKSYQCQIISQTEVFFSLFRDQIIGITGTKGKSTTTSLLYHILKAAGRKTVIAGNIGIPAFDHMDEIDEDTVVVFELSCHQLEYMTVSPHVGILLNIHEEHLDHYGSMEKYIEAKQHIYTNQKEEDVLVCSRQCLPEPGTCRARVIEAADLGMDEADDSELDEVPAVGAVCRESGTKGAESAQESDKLLTLTGSTISWKGNHYQIPADQIHLLGHHNAFDIAIVYAVCMILGLSEEEFTAGLLTFEPLPHRLHYVAVKNGVTYYDDSISTICDTTIQALNTLTDAGTVLIGGMDRGIDYTELIEYLAESPVPHIILMEATGRRIFQEIQERYPNFQGKERLVLTDHLDAAVEMAKKLTAPGHSCVLSPAAASYGIFKNFEERGDAFCTLVCGETEGEI